MAQVAQDQQKFLAFDPKQPAPPMVLPKAEGAGGGGAGGGSGC
jgi:hypothetical protein